MSEGKNQDKLDAIIGYLQQNSIALSTLDRRMDALSADVKVACETMKSITERQAVLERNDRNRLTNCSEVMDAMKRRISALERIMTPIPEPFDPSCLEDKVGNGASVHKDGNGTDTQVFVFVDDDNAGNGEK